MWERERLVHVTKDGWLKFGAARLLQRAAAAGGPSVAAAATEAAYVPVAFAAEAPEAKECPPCAACARHPFRTLKLVFHTANTTPLAACAECYECQWRRLVDQPGVPQLKVYVGCTDVEGVAENSVEDPNYCYDTQERPLPRPSTPPAVRKRNY